MKSKKVLFGLMFLVLTFGLLASCSTFEASGLQSGPNPMQQENIQIVGQFETSVWVNRFLGTSSGLTLGNIGTASIDRAVSKTIQDQILKFGGTGVTNVSISHRSNIVHLLLNMITFTLYAPSEVRISGTVIKQK